MDIIRVIKDTVNFGFRRKIRHIFQSESSECGIACLAMISNYWGHSVDLMQFRQKRVISSQGANLVQLSKIASDINLDSRTLSLDMHELRELKLPCILHWDFNHFVVLFSIGKKYLTIYDPALGKVRLLYSEVAKHFTGIALEVWPTANFVKKKEKINLDCFSLLKNVSGIKGMLTKIFFLSLVIEAFTLVMPMGTQLIFDHVITARDHALLSLICFALVLTILLKNFISAFRSWLSIIMDNYIDIQWKLGLFEHMVNLPFHFFERRKLGDIHARFNSLDNLRGTLTTGIVNGIIDGVLLLGLFIAMFLYDGGVLLWVVLAFVILYLAFRIVTYDYYRQSSAEFLVKDAHVNSHFMETLYSIATLKSLGIYRLRTAQWINLTVDKNNVGVRIKKYDMTFGGANAFINSIESIVILWMGAHLVIDGKMTLGMLIAFNVYRGQFSERAGNIVNLILSIKVLSLHSERIADIAFSEREKVRETRNLVIKGDAAELELKGVRFKYDNSSDYVINDFNLKINKGESVAIVGASGAGKSTIFKIMSGLVEPQDGEVLFNGVDIRQLGVNNFRECISCVLQDDRLFSGSIIDNITSFANDKDVDFAMHCAGMCNIHNDIMSMQMGYETIIGELGSTLSGGQRQRLLIARALYRRPSILFLDEASSNLDLRNEEFINESIRSLNITKVIVAHRQSTIDMAERIVSL
jgi:ATP-binding cassette, subfamily B, bacterial CvaB/MchF/RaxB